MSKSKLAPPLLALLSAACGGEQVPVADSPEAPHTAPRCSLELARAHRLRPRMKQGDEQACYVQCASSDRGSCVALGLLHSEGVLVRHDVEQAARLFAAACTAGYQPGCTHLGELREKGIYVPDDAPRAAELFRGACDEGDALGCSNLGHLYEQGYGVDKDEARAQALYVNACDRGYKPACIETHAAIGNGAAAGAETIASGGTGTGAAAGTETIALVGTGTETGAVEAKATGSAALPSRRSGAFLPLDPFHAGFTIGSGVGWLSDSTVASQKVGKVGPLLHGGLTVEIFDLITTELSLSALFISDENGFSRAVVGLDGHRFVADSSTSVTAVGISGGLRTPELCLTFDEDGFGRPGNPLWTGLYAYARYGTASISGGRSISDCVDCGGSDLTVTSGTFLDTGVNLGFKLGDGLGGSVVTGYRHYFGGASIAGELQITLGFWLF